MAHNDTILIFSFSILRVKPTGRQKSEEWFPDKDNKEMNKIFRDATRSPINAHSNI